MTQLSARTGRGWGRLGAAACAMALTATLGAIGPTKAAAPYVLQTAATYRVDPAAGAASVTIPVTFTNTTPDPVGGFSSFRTVPLSLQAGATAVAARDRTGTLRVTLARQASRTIATVALRTALRYRHSATFTLTYRLADGASPQVRVRNSSVMVPIWGFGTVSTVSVQLPAAYTSRVIGGPLTSSAQNDQTVRSSGTIRDVPHWSALLVAARPTELVTVARHVALAGGTVDLRIRSFADDKPWGAATLDLAASALPALQQAVGLPYTGVGPLVITQSLPSGIGLLSEPASGAQEIAVAFDATPFTVLHQLAHVWIGSDLALERWIREGLASHVAEIAARRLAIPVPDPARADAAAGDPAAISLAAWNLSSRTTPVSPATDAWAYSASWSVIDSVAASIGEDRLRLVLWRAFRGVPAYDSTPNGTVASAARSQPLDSRKLLDQVEEVVGGGASDQLVTKAVEDAFRARVFPSSTRGLLDQRTAARRAYAALLFAARDWGTPDPVRQAMEAWQFSEASSSIALAHRWLNDRDQLLAAARAAALSTPDRLMVRWRTNGGGDAASRELDAEFAFLQAYTDAGRRIDGLNPIERLGVLYGPEPRGVLAGAAGKFAGGDLDGAAVAIERAVALDAGAQGAGVVRLAAGVAAVSVVAAVVLLVLRRLRRSVPSLARL